MEPMETGNVIIGKEAIMEISLGTGIAISTDTSQRKMITVVEGNGCLPGNHFFEDLPFSLPCEALLCNQPQDSNITASRLVM